MRKGVGIVLAFISVLLLGATIVSYSKYQKSVAEYRMVTAQEESTRVRYDRAVNEIVVIQDSLNAIVMGPDAASLVQDRYHLEQGGGPETLHDQSLARIAMLKSAIERTKERIAELDAKVKKNGIKMAGLESMIVGLRRTVTEKEDRIAELSTQVDTLGVRVAGLTTQVEVQQQDIETQQAEITQKRDEIARKREEIATVFYTMGTKDELTSAGIVASQGGVLGLGKTLKPSGQGNPAAFTPLDTDEETVIRVPAEKVQVLSAQPVSSYVIQPVGEKMFEVRIVNPEEFRKIKQVIILKT